MSHTCLYSGDQQDVKQNRLSLISYGDLPVVEKSCAHLDVEGRKPQGTDVDAKGDYRRISKTVKCAPLLPNKPSTTVNETENFLKKTGGQQSPNHGLFLSIFRLFILTS